MTAKLLLPLLVALVAFAPATLRAETRQYGNVIYDIPQGWAQTGSDDGRIELGYDRDDDACQQCRIWIDLGSAENAPIQDWLDEQSRPGEDVTVIGDPARREDTIGDAAVLALLRQVDDDGSGRFQAFFAIDLPDRNELVVFEGAAFDQQSFDRTLATLNGDVVTFLNGLRFVSEGAAPVLGPPEPGDLSGPWFGTEVRNQYNGLTGALDLVLDRESITFYPDGRFYDGISPSGTRSPDVAALMSRGETGVGNYAIDGDEIVLSFASGAVSRLRMLGKNGIARGGVTMRPASFPPDGFRFSGTIRRVSYTALGAGVAGGVSSESTQVFREDGTFTDSSFVGVAGSFDTGGGFAGSSEQPEMTGRYQVAGGRITLTSPDGEMRETSIIIEGKDSVIVGGQPVQD